MLSKNSILPDLINHIRHKISTRSIHANFVMNEDSLDIAGGMAIDSNENNPTPESHYLLFAVEHVKFLIEYTTALENELISRM